MESSDESQINTYYFNFFKKTNNLGKMFIWSKEELDCLKEEKLSNMTKNVDNLDKISTLLSEYDLLINIVETKLGMNYPKNWNNHPY